ncbi:biotin carboxyl carrier protein [Blastococcus saxobsidens]|uniref:Biotin carboxyl carrier protein n=1 Tax=Blastococcus saxobsidens TaxID=138336 RepID=A0A6L9W641_9ACTN|nr:biotin carboxyl carrier protein [Blastococcus saxobsidens]NEK86871.1 biotin carboxyl carrier protein [Blastococcus saxobsidens]
MSAGRPVVRLVDTSLRDGNQSLWGATGLTTGMVEAVGPALERARFHALDFTSSTHLSVGVRFHQEDPWERIARMRAVVPTTPLSLITTGMRFMSWDRSPESVMRMALAALARHGMRRLQIAEPMNDTEAALAVARMAHEEGIEQVVAAVTFTESPVHTDDLYRKAAEALAADPAVDAVYLKDPGGLLTMERTAALVPELLEAVGDVPLELHSHCTTGVAPQVYVLAAQLGVPILHTAIGALANGTSQPSITRLAANLDAVGIDVDIDLAAVAEAEELIAAFAATQGLAPGAPTDYDLSPHAHQVPGGMMGTLKRQLAEMRVPELLPAVLEEVRRVRAELGYPIMVTPYSQFVGSQAVLNVVGARSGQARWSRLPDEVIRYVLGHFGPPPGRVDPDVERLVAASPRTTELDVPWPEPTADELRERARAAASGPVSDDEAVLRAVLPAEQLAAVAAAGPAPSWPAAPPTTPVHGLGDVLARVRALPRWRSLDLSIGDTHISLRRAGDADPTSRSEDPA